MVGGSSIIIIITLWYIIFFVIVDIIEEYIIVSKHVISYYRLGDVWETADQGGSWRQLEAARDLSYNIMLYYHIM